MPEAVVVATARSPIGRAFKGSLIDLRPDDAIIGAGAALIASAVRPVEGDALGERHAEVVPAERAFVEEGAVAFDWQTTADQVAAVVQLVEPETRLVRGLPRDRPSEIDGLAEPPDLAPLIDNDDREVANLHL